METVKSCHREWKVAGQKSGTNSCASCGGARPNRRCCHPRFLPTPSPSFTVMAAPAELPIGDGRHHPRPCWFLCTSVLIRAISRFVSDDYGSCRQASPSVLLWVLCWVDANVCDCRSPDLTARFREISAPCSVTSTMPALIRASISAFPCHPRQSRRRSAGHRFHRARRPAPRLSPRRLRAEFKVSRGSHLTPKSLRYPMLAVIRGFIGDEPQFLVGTPGGEGLPV